MLSTPEARNALRTTQNAHKQKNAKDKILAHEVTANHARVEGAL